VVNPLAPSLLDIALSALDNRHASPQDAFDRASNLIASQVRSDEVTVVALWALGHAAREMNDLAAAERHLTRASELANELGLKWRKAQVQSALVGVLTANGRPEDALEVASEVVHLRSDAERAELEMRRATALEQIGHLRSAISAYDAALPAIHAGPDPLVEIRLLCNRTIALAFEGNTRRALADSLEAERLADEEGQALLAGGASHNTGFVYGVDGDVVSALAAFDRADRRYAEVGYPGRCEGVLAADRCAVLLVAGLVDEAVVSADIAVRVLTGVDDIGDLAEARLLQARSHLACGNHHDALDAADDAHAKFMEAHRPGWAALASHVMLRSRLLSADDVIADDTSLDHISQIAQELDDFGWPAEAVSVRVSAAELAVRAGDTALAERHLQSSAAMRARGRPDRRANVWLATAMLRRLQGNDVGAARAVDAGLRTVLDYQTSVGATDLRVGAAVHAEELGRLGVELAIDTRKPRRILVAAERLRATAFGRTLPGPAAHEQLRGERSRLRELQAMRDPMAQDDSLQEEIKQQERRLQNLARQIRGAGGTRSTLDLAQLFASLGEGQLVEFVEHRGAFGAVTVSAGRCRFHELTPLNTIQDAIETAQFSLQRAGREGASPSSGAAAVRSFEDCMSTIDDLLIAPLRLTSDRVLVVPSGILQNVAWSALPSLRHRHLSITPSAHRWSLRRPGPAATGEVRLIVGPDLQYGEAELAVVAARYATSKQLSGERATASAALALLDHAGIAHVSCHGSFRSDSPMFSSLHMFDGALSVYDLEELQSPPDLVVLPACNAAMTEARSGEQVVGTTSALLGIGVRTVIAPMSTINDRATVAMMDRFHAALAECGDGAQALRSVREEIPADADSATAAVVASLVCME